MPPTKRKLKRKCIAEDKPFQHAGVSHDDVLCSRAQVQCVGVCYMGMPKEGVPKAALICSKNAC
eukprot:4900524-Pleurochrysis_carterae.AAC.1